jgi:carbon-monoxide dehydrogenase large subunit
VRCKEDLRLLTGRGRYIEDRHLPGECHAVFLRPPHARGVIRAIDLDAARHAPGVVTVRTRAEFVADRIGGVPCDFTPPHYPPRPGAPPVAVIQPPHPALAPAACAMSGQAVALILADTPERARDAAELIAVDYEPLPAVVAMMAAIAPDAPQPWRGAPENVAFTWEAGDRAAFAAAHRGVEAEIVNSRIMMAALRPGARSSNSMPQGRYMVYTASQMPHGIREHPRRRRRCRQRLRP